MSQDAPSPPPLRLVSLLAANARPFHRAVGEYLAQRTGLPVRPELSEPWHAQERALDAGDASLGFLCGYLYTCKVGRGGAALVPLVAPVPCDPRAGGEAVYFSDVVVPRDAPTRSFADLRGARWAYNDPGSFSGYALTRWRLRELGVTAGFFGHVVAAGSHQRSLELVAEGAVDGAAIDSTVLATERRLRPDVLARVRVLDAFGPNVAPPLVASGALPDAVREQIRQALLEMHCDPLGQSVLKMGDVLRFSPVADQSYDMIRARAEAAEGIKLVP